MENQVQQNPYFLIIEMPERMNVFYVHGLTKQVTTKDLIAFFSRFVTNTKPYVQWINDNSAFVKYSETPNQNVIEASRGTFKVTTFKEYVVCMLCVFDNLQQKASGREESAERPAKKRKREGEDFISFPTTIPTNQNCIIL